MFAVKFHLKDHRLSKNKYKIQTGLYEPRRIFGTCINILLEISRDNPSSSFGFIGSQDLTEAKKENTKRYKVYRRIVSNLFKPETFKHYEDSINSAYLLIRNSEVERDNDLFEKIRDLIIDNFDYFLIDD